MPTTFTNILVATDLSARSDRAVARACRIAREQGARLHLLHVVDDALPADMAEAQMVAAERTLERVAASLPEAAGLEIARQVVAGDPWSVIVDTAETLPADLLVLGTARPDRMAGLFRGTTLDRVARSARCPVLRVAAPVTGAYRAPVVGVDFSDCARLAARLASRLVPKAPLTLVHVYHVPFAALTGLSGGRGAPKWEKDRVEADISRRLNDLAKTAVMPGQASATILVEGSPEIVLPRQMEALGADLLCLGTHARSWLSEALLGSTAQAMLSDCPCDLLLAPLPMD